MDWHKWFNIKRKCRKGFELNRVLLSCSVEKLVILSIEAYTKCCLGSSYSVFIDLQNKLATYKYFENIYETKIDKEFIIEDAVVVKLRLEMESIRILEWEKE